MQRMTPRDTYILLGRLWYHHPYTTARILRRFMRHRSNHTEIFNMPPGYIPQWVKDNRDATE